jgi:hypothetical protein
MADILSKWQELRILVESLEVDVKKTAKGNKTAGVRARRGLRQLKKDASELVKVTLGAEPTDAPQE